MYKPIRVDGKLVSIEVVECYFRSLARIITSSQMIILYIYMLFHRFT
jgi:hypothetical protein